MLQLSDYLLNMVMMIGLGIAIDYSLLVVNRYRDERRDGPGPPDAVDETMTHAGRTIVFSGLVVSLGLALMLLLPVPFLRGFGLGGLLVPAVSMVCALTLLPVLLLALGERLEGLRLMPRRLAERRHAGRDATLDGTRRLGDVARQGHRAGRRDVLVARGAAADRDPRRAGIDELAAQGIPSVQGLVALQNAGSSLLGRPDDDRRRHRLADHGATDAAVAKLDRLLRADPR